MNEQRKATYSADLFTNRLRFAMGVAKTNQRKLAQALEISESTLAKYLNDGVQPTAPVLAKMAVTLNVSVDWLLGIK